MSDDYTPYALIADDDALIRMDAVDILSDAGFTVLRARLDELAARGLIRLVNRSAANFYIVDGLTQAGRERLGLGNRHGR